MRLNGLYRILSRYGLVPACGVVITFLAILLYRFSLSYFLLHDGTTVYVFPHDPDVFYHLKRIVSIFNGNFSALFLDPTIHFPCGFRPPWPPGFDGILALGLKVMNVLRPSPEADELIDQAGILIVMISLFNTFVLYKIMGLFARDTLSRLTVLFVVSQLWVVSDQFAFGVVDNQIADLTVFLVCVWLVASGKWSGSWPALAVLCAVGLASSDYTLPVVGLFIVACLWMLVTGRVAEIRAYRRSLRTVILSSVFMLIVEWGCGFRRSYSGVLAPLVTFMLAAAVFAELKMRHVLNSRTKHMLAIGGFGLVQLISLRYSEWLGLFKFFLGQDGIVETIHEAAHPWRFFPVYEFVLTALSVPVASFFVWKKGFDRFSRVYLVLLLWACLLFYLLQVKFTHLLVVAIAISLQQGVLMLVSGMRLQNAYFAISRVALIPAVLGFFALSLFQSIPHFKDHPTTKMRALYRMTEYIRTRSQERECRVITSPNYGTAVNFLTGCTVSATTFWGDSCSREMHVKSLSAQKEMARALTELYRQKGYRYLFGEIAFEMRTKINKLGLSIIHSEEFFATHDVRMLFLLVDLSASSLMSEPKVDP